MLDDGDHRAIGRVAAAASARSRGPAARLMETGLELCAGQPVEPGAQAYLEGWYERFGFRRSGPSYVEDGIPHVPMRPGRLHRAGFRVQDADGARQLVGDVELPAVTAGLATSP